MGLDLNMSHNLYIMGYFHAIFFPIFFQVSNEINSSVPLTP
jgi:hypothetical protein